MKARLFYLATMLMAMFAITSCNNDDILNDENLITERIEVFQLESKEYEHATHIDGEWDGVYYKCYENKDELEDTYAIEDAKLLNWQDRTLVLTNIRYHSGLYDFTTNVYVKDGKYVIEILEKGIDIPTHTLVRFTIHAHECYGVLLDKPNIKVEDVIVKVGILSRNDAGELYHKFL